MIANKTGRLNLNSINVRALIFLLHDCFLTQSAPRALNRLATPVPIQDPRSALSNYMIANGFFEHDGPPNMCRSTKAVIIFYNLIKNSNCSLAMSVLQRTVF